MANSLTGHTLLINVEGILFQGMGGVWVQKVRFLRNAFDDVVTFTYWDENGTPDHHFSGISVVVTSGTIFTNASFVSGAPAENDIVYFYNTSSGSNKFRVQVSTDGGTSHFDADALNSWHGAITNETMTANCKIWTPKTAFSFKAGTDVNAEQTTETIDFGYQGKFFPNLAINGLTASATLEMWIR